MGFYKDLVAYNIYEPYFCLEFGGGKVYTGIIRNNIGRSEVDIDPIKFQSLLNLLRYKHGKETTYLKRCGYINYI